MRKSPPGEEKQLFFAGVSSTHGEWLMTKLGGGGAVNKNEADKVD